MRIYNMTKLLISWYKQLQLAKYVALWLCLASASMLSSTWMYRVEISFQPTLGYAPKKVENTNTQNARQIVHWENQKSKPAGNRKPEAAWLWLSNATLWWPRMANWNPKHVLTISYLKTTSEWCWRVWSVAIPLFASDHFKSTHICFHQLPIVEKSCQRVKFPFCSLPQIPCCPLKQSVAWLENPHNYRRDTLYHRCIW